MKHLILIPMCTSPVKQEIELIKNRASFMSTTLAKNVFEGKNLKLALCLLRHMYFSKEEISSPFSEITRKKYEKVLRIAFPYYRSDSLREFIDSFLLFISDATDIRNKITRLYFFYFHVKYEDDVKTISSPDLYHFVNKDYLLSILKNKFLYPSFVTIDEYKKFLNEYEGAIQKKKQYILENSKFEHQWNNSILRLQKMINSNDKKNKFETYFQEKSFIPAMNCFTELPRKMLELHASHYGSYGIRFRKTSIVSSHNYFHEKSTKLNFIRPIYYCDNSKCSLPWLIMEKLFTDQYINEEEKKKLMTDLYLLKPIDDDLYDPKKIYSVINEREWRFVSFEKLFTFKKEEVCSVVLSKKDYEQFLNGKVDDALSGLVTYCRDKKIPIEYI